MLDGDWTRVKIEAVTWWLRKDGRFVGLGLKTTRQAGLPVLASKPGTRPVRLDCRGGVSVR